MTITTIWWSTGCLQKNGNIEPNRKTKSQQCWLFPLLDNPPPYLGQRKIDAVLKGLEAIIF
jgi:hypothetical protein